MKKRLCALVCLALICAGASACAEEARQSMGDYLTEQYLLLELTGYAGEMDAFDEMERHIAGGNVRCSEQDVSIFYCDYMRLLTRHGQTEQVRSAAEHYIGLTEALAYAVPMAELGLEDSIRVTALAEFYVEMLGYSTLADDLFVAALERYAAYLEAYAQTVTPEADPLYAHSAALYDQMAAGARFYALAFSGRAQQAVALAEAMVARYAGEPATGRALRMEYAPDIALLGGDPAEAAARQAERIAYTLSLLPSASAQTLYESALNIAWTYASHAVITPEAFDAYAQALPVSLAFVITELSDVGRENGLAQGDRLLAIDGVALRAPQQTRLLLEAPADVEITVLRAGERIVLPVRTRTEEASRYGIRGHEVRMMEQGG